MKKSVLLLIGFIFTTSIIAQTDSLAAPYKRFPSFPPAKLLLPDSVSFFTKADLPKKMPVMLMVFSPDCEHCQHETEELINNIDKFKNILIVMTTTMPFDSMLAYREKYHLERYKNIIVAQDTDYFLFTFYQVHNLPFLAFYDKKKELISVFEGGLSMKLVLKEFEK